jgi:outer membrane protein
MDRASGTSPYILLPEAGREETRAMLGDARSSLFPSLRLSGSATRYEDPTLVHPIHGFTPGELPPFERNLFQGSMQMSYLLWNGSGRAARIESARRSVDAADQGVAGARQQLLTRVAAVFLDVLSRSKLLEAQDRRLASLGAERQRVADLLRVGKAAEVDRLRIEAGVSGAAAERVAAAAALDVAERELARLIGCPSDSARAARLRPVALADTTLPAEESDLLARALKENPILLQSLHQANAARAAGRAARSQRLPEAKLVGSLLGFSDDKGHDTSEWNAGVAVSVPLFTGGALSSAVDRADAGTIAARERLRIAELALASDLDRAVSGCAVARARVRSLERSRAAQAEVARITRLALANGSSTEPDFLDAEADLLAAEAALLDARDREILARVELARALGDLDLDWVRTTLEVD